MSKKFRTALVIVLATLGSLVVIFLILWATWTLTMQTKSVASFVPADKTVLLLHWPTQATYDKAQELFPSLIPTTLPPETAALALIETATGSLAQVIFLEETNPILKTLSSAPPLLPPYAVIVSDAKLTPLIGEHDGNLADAKDYKNVRTHFTARQPWSYARRSALPPLSAADALLAATFFGDATSVGVGSNSGTIILSVTGMKSVQGISNNITTQYVPNSFLVLHGDRLTSLFQTADGEMNEESSVIAKAGLQQVVQELLGDSVSLQYDLLPLLSGETTLELAYGSGGNLLFALHGEQRDSATLEKKLTLIQKSADNLSNQVEIQDRTFDEKFPSRNVRTKPEDNTTKNVNGWDVVESRRPDGSLLVVIATSGNKFLVTNSSDAATLKNAGSITSPSEKGRGRGSLMASGYLQKEDLYRLLQRFTVGIQSPSLAVPSGTYLWSLRVSNGSRTLLLKPAKKTGTL